MKMVPGTPVWTVVRFAISTTSSSASSSVNGVSAGIWRISSMFMASYLAHGQNYNHIVPATPATTSPRGNGHGRLAATDSQDGQPGAADRGRIQYPRTRRGIGGDCASADCNIWDFCHKVGR